MRPSIDFSIGSPEKLTLGFLEICCGRLSEGVKQWVENRQSNNI
jgi:hypothetical protein